MKRYPRNSQWQHLSKEAVLQLQADKLRRYLRDTVVPFSAYYREVFRRHGLRADSIRSVEDLEQIPFTSKIDLVNSPEHPQRSRDFVLIPDQEVLARRSSTIVQALLHGREYVKEQFEYEFRPYFLTSTSGRSADPVPLLYSIRDLELLGMAGRRVM